MNTIAITSFWGGAIGLLLGVAVGWMLFALLSSGKEHDKTLEDHQAKNN
jgi:ABC-type antimicrobial peptide transport system permease subunit